MRAISLSFSVILFSTAAFASTPAVLVIDEQVPVQELQALIANIPESYEVISPENLSIHLKTVGLRLVNAVLMMKQRP